MGKDGKPAEVIEVNGESIHKTGIDLFDEDEERWANQKSIEQLLAEKEAKEVEDLLDENVNLLDEIKESAKNG